jgi:molecular chaperone GrpE
VQEAAARGHHVEPEPSSAEDIDLHTLLAQFTALRHEVNLQTRAVRAQQEQNAQTLETLQRALEELADQEAVQPPSSNEDHLRSQLKTLIELYDALALGQREIQRARETVLPTLERLANAGEEGPPVAASRLPENPRATFFTRLFGSARAGSTEIDSLRDAVVRLQEALAAERARAQDAQLAAERARRLLESLLAGYTMSLQRLDRALEQHELEPIDCVGQPFDPERMEVLEVVYDSGRPSGEVLEEVRRGYRWRGRVFRFAQVRVAKSA